MSRKFSPRMLPWLIALGAIVVYSVTLNQWVSLLNLAYVARISGWLWQPETYSPTSFLVTYPFRWLPAASIPVVLNIFSALCAAGTLGLLARSVALLPQDRTAEQRLRVGKGQFSFLTGGGAWLPPVLAVTLCGLQLTFWEQATNCAGEMFDLLLFALVIWSLLEYRIDRREWRMAVAALVYGAGMAENWAMVGFFPVFLWAVFRIQTSATPGSFQRFATGSNSRVFALVALGGFAGGMLYLLLPLIAATADGTLTFWQALRANLAMQESMLKQFVTHRDMTVALGRPMLASLLPAFAMTLRWNRKVPEDKPARVPTVLFFHLVSAAFLAVCLWNAFDPPSSPRRLGYGYPFLTFYYLNALAAGYYAGYFLVVARRRNSPVRKSLMRRLTLNTLALGALSLLLALTGAVLVYKNAPQILATNDETMVRYAALMERELPRGGGILAGADSRTLFLAQAVLARDGRAGEFVPLDLSWFHWPVYHRFLRAKFPNKWPDTVDVNEEEFAAINPARLTGLLAALAQTNVVFGLQPDPGRYGGRIWLDPHGLVYKVTPLAADGLLPPVADADEIKRNETFWRGARQWEVDAVADAAPPPGPAESWFGRLLTGLRASRERNPNATTAAAYYARALDFWGVRLQRAGELELAAAHFQLARRLNPANQVAQINLQFNDALRAGHGAAVDVSARMEDQFGGGRTWAQITEAYGPLDEPSFCFLEAHAMARMNLPGPAAELFARVIQLAPDFFPARVWLAGLYVGSGLPDRALETLQGMHARPEQRWLAAAEQARYSFGEADAYFARRELTHSAEVLERAITADPANDDLAGAAVEVYIYRGLLTNALALVDNRLRLNPGDPGWTFARGYISLRQTNYDSAISAFSTVLAARTNHVDARLNRAVAYLESNQLDAARTDFETLAQMYPASAQAALGLGEIAWRKKETNEAVRCYGIFLANAKANSALAADVRERLKALKAVGN